MDLYIKVLFHTFNILKCDQMKATEQYVPVVLFIMLYKVVLTFESVDKILKCDHSNEATEQYFPVVLFIILYKMVLTFESVDGASYLANTTGEHQCHLSSRFLIMSLGLF